MKSIKSIDQFPQSTVAFHVARELEASQSGSKFGKACRGSLEGFNDFGGYGDWRLGKFRRKTLCFVSLSLGMECVNQFRVTDVAQNNSASSNAKTLMRLESGMNDWTRAHTRAAIRASALLIVHLITAGQFGEAIDSRSARGYRADAVHAVLSRATELCGLYAVVKKALWQSRQCLSEFRSREGYKRAILAERHACSRAER